VLPRLTHRRRAWQQLGTHESPDGSHRRLDTRHQLSTHKYVVLWLRTDAAALIRGAAATAQVFGSKAWESSRKYFRFLHFTTEDERSVSPRVLRFSFNLPPLDKARYLPVSFNTQIYVRDFSDEQML